MRLVDIVSMGFHNLWQRKIRTCLNLVGIVIGCIVVLMTAASASGVKRAVQAIFDSSEFAKEIRVRGDAYSGVEPPPGTIVVEGKMSDQRRERIHKALVDRWKNEHIQPNGWRMTLDEIRQLNGIPHVERVIPENHFTCTLGLGTNEFAADIFSADVGSRRFAKRIIAGQMLTDLSRDEILINEVMAYRLGYRSDAELDALVGQELTVTYQVSGTKIGSIFQYLSDPSYTGPTAASLADQVAFAGTLATLVSELDKTSLTEQQKEMIRSITKDITATSAPAEGPAGAADERGLSLSRRFRVRGVVRVGDEDSIADLFRRWFHGTSGDLFLHHRVATDIQSQDPERIDDYHSVAVIVDSAQHLAAVTEAIEARGLLADSSLRVLESIHGRINSGSWFIYAIAAAVLLASALGISNTLVISVLQRTPEFGILKAVGARDRDLVVLMLCEGALLGVIGATLALALAWVLSWLGHGLVARFMQGRFGSELPGELIAFEVWPVLMMYVIAIVICIGASILPAWRAARLDPVVAMRRT